MPRFHIFKDLFHGRKSRRSAEPGALMVFLETSRWITASLFAFTVIAIVVISSVRLNTANIPFLPNQLATTRITAAVSFSYESLEKTNVAREQILNRVPRVYRLEGETLIQFEEALQYLQDQIIATEIPAESNEAPPIEIPVEIITALESFNEHGPYRANLEDLKLLINGVSTERRAVLIESGLHVLRKIYADGVHDHQLSGASSSNVTVLQMASSEGDVGVRRVQSLSDALTYLRINLSGEDVPRPVSLALFRILRNGVTPNLVFDRKATELREQAAAARIKPVIVKVVQGETIIEPDTRVSSEQYEMFMAHRRALNENKETRVEEGLHLFGRLLLVLAMVLASVFYVRLEDRETFTSNGRLALLALVVILNISMIRAVYSLGSLEFFLQNSDWASTLPYIALSAFAPLIVAILIDAGSAIFMALFISIFTGVIYGNRLDILVITFLASTIAIFASRDVRKRSRVVRAATYGGFTVALFALLVGFADQLPLTTLSKQFGAGLVSGAFTGILVVGLLPVLESLFKRTTDITLLELTDYNHPLLRLMQLQAPGTYHHSLIVAQLSENAANEIGANPILARVCALYHDIGKTVKPEYFIENQRSGTNPHDTNNPSLSALIIKSHVKEGVDLARKHRLPRAIINVIRQHHGTSLIRYFYHRAITDLRDSAAPFLSAAPRGPLLPGINPADVCETTYRYDGPIPRFTESAIISLADSVEAASRSLRKVSPQHLGELIDSVFRLHIEDHQLDDAPLTFAQLSKVKASFNHTMLNMLHSRVDYPEESNSNVTPKA